MSADYDRSYEPRDSRSQMLSRQLTRRLGKPLRNFIFGPKLKPTTKLPYAWLENIIETKW